MADTVVTQATGFTPRKTSVSGNFMLNQVDPSGLDSVTVQLATSLFTTVSVTNSEATAGSFKIASSGRISLLRPGIGAVLSTTPSNLFTTALAPGQVSTGLGTSAVRDTVTYKSGTAEQDALLFVGSGLATFAVDTSARSTGTTVGNIEAHVDSGTYAELTATGSYPSPSVGAFGVTSTAGSVTVIDFTSVLPTLTPTVRILEASTAPQTITAAQAATGSSTALTLAGFDASLGRLIRVDVSTTNLVQGAVRIENRDATSAYGYVDQAATVDFVVGGLRVGSSTQSFGVSALLGAFDGTADYSGASGVTFAAQQVNGGGGFGRYTTGIEAFTGSARGAGRSVGHHQVRHAGQFRPGDHIVDRRLGILHIRLPAVGGELHEHGHGRELEGRG